MIEIKKAVAVAKEFITYLNAELGEMKELTLEEISQTEDGDYWLVTLGFSRPKTPENTIWPTNGMERIYKTIRIDRSSGEPVAMQIRTV